METILVQVFVPAAGIKIDALLPKNCQVERVITQLAEAVESYSHGYFKANGTEVLCAERLGVVLIPGTDICAYRLLNGDRLVLI